MKEKNILNKIFAVITVLVMVFTSIPTYVIAEEIKNNLKNNEVSNPAIDNAEINDNITIKNNGNVDIAVENAEEQYDLNNINEENQDYGVNDISDIMPLSENEDVDGFQIALRIDKIGDGTYKWHADKDENDRVIKLTVYYQNLSTKKEYKQNEIKIVVPGIGKLNRASTLKAINIAADEYASEEKKRDWSYTYDKETDTYTFYNNKNISMNEKFNGSFELLFEFSSRSCVNGYTQKLQAVVDDGTTTVKSKELELEFTSKEDEYTITKSGEVITSADGLSKFVPEGKSVTDYAWVRYKFRYNVKEKNSRGLKECYILDKLPEGCIIADENNVIHNDDGTVSYKKTGVSTSSDYYVIVGYPCEDMEEGQEKEQTNTVNLQGTYYDDEEDKTVATGSSTVKLKKIEKQKTSGTPDKVMSPDYVYSDSLQNDINFTATLYATATTSSEENEYQIAITDDVLEILANNEIYKKLKDDEYKFTKITVPGRNNFKNVNGYTLPDGEYKVTLYALYKKNVDENNPKSRDIDKYTQIYTGEWKNQSITQTISEDAVAVRAVISGLTESVNRFYISVGGTIDISEYENPTYIYNNDFIDLLDKEGNSILETVKENERLKEEDTQIYGKAVSRAQDYIRITERPKPQETPGSYYATASIQPFTVSENVENFMTKLSHGITVNNKDGKEITGIQIYGVNQKEELENLIDTLEFTGSGLSFKYALSDDVNISEYLKERATITQENNEITVEFNFEDNPITSKSFSVGYKLDGSLNYEEYYNTSNPSYTTTTYAYIENGGLTANNSATHKEKRMSEANDTESILLALSSHQQMSKSVRTQYSGDFVQEKAVSPMDTQYTYRLKLRNGYNTLINTEFIDILEHAELTHIEGEEQNPQSDWYGKFLNVDTSYLNSINIEAEVYYADTTQIDEHTEWIKMEKDESEKWTVEDAEKVKTVKIKITSEVPDNSVIYLDINMKSPKDKDKIDKYTYNTYSITCNAKDLYTGITSSYMKNVPSNTTDVRLVEKEYRVVITKTDAVTGNKLSGVEFNIYDEDNNLVGTHKTGILGNLVITSLKEGTYRIEEVEAPVGYDKIEGYKLIIKDGKYHVEYIEYQDEEKDIEFSELNNEESQWGLKDDELNDKVLQSESNYNQHNKDAVLTSDEFTISKKGVVTFDWSVSSENADYVYYTITNTNTNEKIAGTGNPDTKMGGTSLGSTYENLKYNKVSKKLNEGTYKISFTYHKDGSVNTGCDRAYVKNLHYTTKVPVEKTGESCDILIENSIPTINLNIQNKKALGSITVYKIDEYLNSSKKETPLSGVKFDLVDMDDKVISTGTTDSKGNILFDDLEWGKTYKLRENGTYAGYETVEENTYLSGSNKDKTVTVKNIRKTGTATITKKDENDNTPIEGATYGLYANGNIYNQNGDIIYTKDKLIKTAKTNEQGVATFEGIAWGSYYIQEYKTVYGYELSTTKYTFEITKSNVATTVSKNEAEKRSKGSIQIIKRDDDGNFIEGVEFKLFKSDGKEVIVKDEETGNAIPYLTDDLGRLKIGNLEWGEYYIQEYRPASGYEKDDTKFHFKIDRETFKDSDTVYKVKIGDTEEETGEIINHKKKGKVKLTKYKCDASGQETEEKLQGAIYELYLSSGELKGTYTTDENGEINVEDLEWGGYYFLEKQAPSGFSISDKKVSFVINGKTADFLQEVKAYDKLESGEIKINKKIKAESIYSAHGNSTFIFKIVGKDEAGEIKVTLYRAVTFTEEDLKKVDGDGYITKEIVITEAKPYKYEITEEETYRYDVTNVEPGENASVQGYVGIIDLLESSSKTEGENEEGTNGLANGEEQSEESNVKKGEVTFTNDKTSQSLLTHTSLVTNSTQSEYYVVGISAKTVDETYEARTNVDKDDFKYTLLYSGGQEVEVDISEIGDVKIDGQDEYTQRAAGIYLVTLTVTYKGKEYEVEAQIEFVRNIRILADEVEVGDYVAYDANAGLTEPKTYTTDSAVTGYTSSTQTFSSKNSMKWRVLSVDRDSGEVQLIAVNPTSNLYLRGIDGYLNAEDVINSVADVYGHGTGAKSARSLTIEDLEKYTGDAPKEAYTNSNSSTKKVGGTRTYSSGKFINDPTDGTEITGGTVCTDNEKLLEASSSDKVTVEQTYYNYTASNYFDTDDIIYKLLFRNEAGTGNKNYYWLASRCVNLYSSNCRFSVRYVSSGDVSANNMYYSNGSVYSDYYGVLPVVSLESNILTGGKNSSGAWTLKTE